MFSPTNRDAVEASRKKRRGTTGASGIRTHHLLSGILVRWMLNCKLNSGTLLCGKDTYFILPEGGRAAETFQSLFSHIDGKIRDGYGEDGCGRKVGGWY
jgi:hypothetical protein